MLRQIIDDKDSIFAMSSTQSFKRGSVFSDLLVKSPEEMGLL